MHTLAITRVARPLHRRLVVATLVVLLLGGARSLLDSRAAHAQQLGGTVDSVIALLIGSPTALTRIGSGTYQIEIPVTVSSTVFDTRLSISDGEDYGRAAQGRLRTAAGLLAQPLQTSVAGGASASLASLVDPQLKRWSTALAQQPATILLRQHMARGVALPDSVQKILLVTLSSTAP